MFDFCYNVEEQKQIFKEAKSCVIYDHHEGKKDFMQNYSNCYYDEEHSGAYLAFRYYFGTENVPLFIRYIQDRDLWSWKLKDSRQFSCYLFYEIQFDLDVWYETFCDDERQCFISDDNLLYKLSVETGDLYYKIQSKIVSSVVRAASRLTFCNVPAAIINTKDHISEVAECILETKKDVSVAIVWSFDHKKSQYRFSIRSRKDEVDCSVLAKLYGGDGHKQAAGFRVTSLSNEIPELLNKFNNFVSVSVKQ